MIQEEFLVFAAMMESSFTAEKHEHTDDELFKRLEKIYYGEDPAGLFNRDMKDMYETLREKARRAAYGN